MSDESKGSVVRARCSADLKSRVSKFASDFGTDEAEIIRMALEEYMDRNKDAESLSIVPPRPPTLKRVVPNRKLETASEAAIGVSQVRKPSSNRRP